MTGPEHYAAAEQHAGTAEELHAGDQPAMAEFYLRLTEVHATLAVAAAAAINNADGGLPGLDERAWRRAAGEGNKKPDG